MENSELFRILKEEAVNIMTGPSGFIDGVDLVRFFQSVEERLGGKDFEFRDTGSPGVQSVLKDIQNGKKV